MNDDTQSVSPRMFSQESQNLQGPQTNVAGDVQGPMLTGQFSGPVTVITGAELYPLFAQAPLLSRYIRVREFQTLVNERTRNFIGREFIFDAIDRLLEKGTDFPSGYIVISGEPGIGKTSLMAQLVKEKGYVHHFNIAAQNIRSVRDFLANLCAQLIVRYGLDHPILPEEATKDSGFLSQLFAESVNKADGKQVVVLVDALDEAEHIGTLTAVNRLYLPPVLPEGVFVVITTRPQTDYCLAVDNREDIYLKDTDPRNMDDVIHYIRSYLASYQDAMVTRLAAWQMSEEEFVTEIAAKSQGNFMYVFHVLRDIRDCKLTKTEVGDVRRLPQGLRGYYQHHWRKMKLRYPELFESTYEPVLCLLATVREPVSLHQIAEWSKHPLTQVRAVVLEWQEFLNIEETPQGETLFRVYHTSFQDFLKEQVGLVRYHQMISSTAEDKVQWQYLR